MSNKKIIRHQRDPWRFLLLLALCVGSFLCVSLVFAEQALPSESDDELSDDATEEMLLGRGESGYADLLKAIRVERKALVRREQNLVKNEKRLAEMKGEIAGLLESNQTLVDELRKAKLQTSEAQVRLAKIYGGMPAEEAAARLEKMDNNLAVTLLRHMKDKATGAILGQLPVEKAAELTVALTKPTAP